MAISMTQFSALKTSLESGYGLTVGIVDPVTMAYKPGCSVTSTASRRSVAVDFVATVQLGDAITVNVTAAAEKMTAATLVANVQKAVDKSDSNVTGEDTPCRPMKRWELTYVPSFLSSLL